MRLARSSSVRLRSRAMHASASCCWNAQESAHQRDWPRELPRELMENFNRKPSRGLEIERPRAMKAGWLCHVVPILPQTLVDFVDSFLALLDESNMKAGGILQLSPFCGSEQRQNHAVVVGQETHRFDLIPSFRTKLSMISAKGRGRVYVEEQAHGGADDRGAEATGGGAQGRGRGAGSGGVQAHDLCVEGEVWWHGCEPGAGGQT